MMKRLTNYLLILILLLLAASCKRENEEDSPQISDVQYITTGDVKMAYRTIGEGYPLLLCMGYTGVMDMWPKEILQKLAGSYKVILFENRGMGYSTIINDTSIFSMKLFAKDAANLMNALKISKAHIMGWSMGTYTTQELALGYPEKVDKVILYAADCGDDITIQPDSALLASFTDPNATPETKLLAIFPAEWMKRSDALAYFPLDIIEADPNICKRQDVALKNWFKKGGGTSKRLSSFGKKTLLITGDQDICTPWQNTLIMQSLIDSCKILILPGGGHGVIFQYPYLFADHVLTFLAEK